MGDQHANGKEAQRIGFGLHLSYQSLTEDQLSKAVQAVLTQPGFAAKAKQYGSAVMDQKEHPLDRYNFQKVVFLGYSCLFYRF